MQVKIPVPTMGYIVLKVREDARGRRPRGALAYGGYHLWRWNGYLQFFSLTAVPGHRELCRCNYIISKYFGERDPRAMRGLFYRDNLISSFTSLTDDFRNVRHCWVLYLPCTFTALYVLCSTGANVDVTLHFCASP